MISVPHSLSLVGDGVDLHLIEMTKKEKKRKEISFETANLSTKPNRT
jgi:hypothetical protein